MRDLEQAIDDVVIALAFAAAGLVLGICGGYLLSPHVIHAIV